nr:hypothetical protein [Xanthomonas campestris]
MGGRCADHQRHGADHRRGRGPCNRRSRHRRRCRCHRQWCPQRGGSRRQHCLGHRRQRDGCGQQRQRREQHGDGAADQLHR